MKKKKKSVLTKKEKIIIIVVAIAMLFLIIGIALTPTKRDNTTEQSNSNDLNRELTSVKDVVEYLESTYISMNASQEDGYDYDIYVNFKYNLYEGDESKELYFTNFYEQIARVTNFTSFRIIDTSRDIKISVKCSNSKIKEVTINGETEYFKKEASRRSKEAELKVEQITMKVDSKVLQDLISAKWKTENVDLGTQESTFDKYKIYFDEGYEIRTIQGKVYNIVFTEKYENNVVNGYKPGDNLGTIEAEFGESYKDSGIIGYQTKDFYIFFSNNEISVYPNYSYDYEEFENLVKEYDDKKDINDFMDKLTDIWPDYDQYNYDTNYVEISYALKGVKISFNSYEKEGIQIYENYKGSLKQEKTDYTDVYYKLNEDLFLEKEKVRPLSKELYDNSGITEDPIHYSNKFYLSATASGNFYKNIKIIAIDKDYPNNEFDDTISIYTYVWADDIHFIYSIYGNGIYLYNAETRETEQLINGTEEYKITNYDRSTNIIEYDNNQAKISF